MKTSLRWNPPDDVFSHHRRTALRLTTHIACRSTATGLLIGFGIWYAAIRWIPVALPTIWFTVVPWIIVGVSAQFWLLPLSWWRRTTVQHSVNRSGLNGKPWFDFKSFTVEAVPDFSHRTQLLFVLKTGRERACTLPEDKRLASAIVGLAARKIGISEKE